MQLSIPNSIPLPCLPTLARLASSGNPNVSTLGHGDVLNIINATPDGSSVAYIVCRQASGNDRFHHGWLPREAVQIITPAEAAELPETVHLTMREWLQHVTLMSVEDDWQSDEDGTLGLWRGDVLQVCQFREGGWAFGWLPENPARRGWFPSALVNLVDSCIDSLKKTEIEELSASASAALVTVLKDGGTPPPLEWTWEGELPSVVAESAHQLEREFRDNVAQMEADAAAAAAAAAALEKADTPTNGLGNNIDHAETTKMFVLEDEGPDESFPLVVCKEAFNPPGGSRASALLQILPGDLVRVTSPLDALMYHGFKEGKRSLGGWFPKKNVQIVEDPLKSAEEDVYLGPLPMPRVPQVLLQRRSMQ